MGVGGGGVGMVMRIGAHFVELLIRCIFQFLENAFQTARDCPGLGEERVGVSLVAMPAKRKGLNRVNAPGLAS